MVYCKYSISVCMKKMSMNHINLLILPHKANLPSGEVEFPNTGLVTSSNNIAVGGSGVDIIPGTAEGLFVKDPKIAKPRTPSSSLRSKESEETANVSTDDPHNEEDAVGDMEPGDFIWQRCQQRGCRVTVFKPLAELHPDRTEKNTMERAGQKWRRHTDVACHFCTFEFESRPIPFASGFNKVRQLFTVTGCFCSFECALAWGLKQSAYNNRGDIHQWFYQLLTERADRPRLRPAPPITMLKRFGGIWSIDQYRSTFGAPVIIEELIWPIVFHSNAVELRECMPQTSLFDSLEVESNPDQILPHTTNTNGSNSPNHTSYQWSNVGTPYTYHSDGGSQAKAMIMKKRSDLALRARIEQARRNKRKVSV